MAWLLRLKTEDTSFNYQLRPLLVMGDIQKDF